MTIIFIATQPEEERNLLGWAAHIATSQKDELTVLLSQRKTGDTRLLEVPTEESENDSELVTQSRLCIRELESAATPANDNGSSISPVHIIKLYQLVGENWKKDIRSHITELKPNLVIAPAPAILKDHTSGQDWQTEWSPVFRLSRRASA